MRLITNLITDHETGSYAAGCSPRRAGRADAGGRRDRRLAYRADDYKTASQPSPGGNH